MLSTAYQEERSSLLDYLENEYRIKISRMSPNRIFLFLINPPSGNVRMFCSDRGGKGGVGRAIVLPLLSVGIIF